MLSPISHPPRHPQPQRAHSHHPRPSHGISGLRPITSMTRSNSYNTQYQPLPHRNEALPPTPDPSPPSSKQLASPTPTPVMTVVKTIPLSTGETPPRSAPPSTRARSPVDMDEPPTRPLRRSTMVLANERDEERFMSGAAVSGTMSLGREQGMGALESLEGKVVLLGSQGVGKTSLILRYTTRTFAENTANVTVGASLFTRKLVYEGVRVRLQIWDTAGQERFRSMAPMYYRGAHAAILVYDITDAQSFTDVQSWLDELRKSMPTETVIHIVGAKLDLHAKRVVSLTDACKTVKRWMSPQVAVASATPPTPPMSPTVHPAARTMFRSPSLSSRIALSTPAPAAAAPAVVTPPKAPVTPATSPPQVAPSPPRPIPSSNDSHHHHQPFPFPTLTSPTSPSFTSPTSPVALARPSLVSATSTTNPSRHAQSGGRFSISNRLGIGRANSVSAAATLARTVEAAGPAVLSGFGDGSTPRTRADTLNLLSPDAGRRKSEDWSGRSWRTGGGPGVAEGLGEFGEGVRRRGSGSLLMRPAGETFARRFNEEAEPAKPVEVLAGEDDRGWGRLVAGVRVGECSAKTGDGIEALFLSIASILVSRREKIERDRVRRERESVMLPSSSSPGLGQGRKDKEKNKGCC